VRGAKRRRYNEPLNLTDDEFTKSLNARRSNLTSRKQIGTKKWLEEKIYQQEPEYDN
jgi:hypothetical protein